MANATLGIHCQDCVRDLGNSLFVRFYLQSLARELLPAEKVKDCMRTIAPMKANVQIVRGTGARKAHYRNLIVCSRIWQCAVCAATVSEKRRKELTLAISKSGLYPVLITYTLRHNARDKLPDLLKALLDAFRAMKSGRSWQDMTKEFFWMGSVRALEVTYGENGWHPHLHELALLQIPVTGAIESGIESWVKDHWRKAVEKQGYNATWQHGADVKTEEHSIRDYVVKFGRLPKETRWTVEHELTKAVVKKSHADGTTPLGLLHKYGLGDQQAGKLFVEYARSFKGKNQLVWSRGLREMLGFGIMPTDEQLAEDEGESGRILASLSRSEWATILSLNHRAGLLEYASGASESELSSYLTNLLHGEKQKTSA